MKFDGTGSNPEAVIPSILIVDDIQANLSALAALLEGIGCHVVLANSGNEALRQLLRLEFAVVLLDVQMPNMDGYEVAEHARQNPDTKDVPIIFLTAKSMTEDKMEGFLLGGDDYVTKPYSFEELKMRIEVFLRRRKIIEEAPKEALTLGKYHFDYPNLDLSINGTTKGLTQREADILYYLATKPNQVIRRSDILEDIWGKDDYFYGRSLDVFISRLRKYLSEDPEISIENVHSVGFKLNVG